jgi:hypothetical protein
MNKKNYQVAVDRAQDGKASEVLIIPGHKNEPVRLQAQPGATYTLSDKSSDKAPQQIFGRRQGKHLHLQLDVQRPGEAADLILENFFEVAPGTIVGMAEDASTYRFIPKTAQEFDQLSLLSDGGSASQVLGGAVFVAGAGAPLVVAAAPLIAAGGLALGPAGMAAAGLLGVAALAGGGGGGGANTSTPQLPLFGASIADEDDSGAKNDGITNNPRPSLTGMAKPNSRVSVKVGNAQPVEVDTDETGRWTWEPSADLADGDYEVQVAGFDAKGTLNSDTIKLKIDTQVITATLSNNLGALEGGSGGKVDNTLNVSESQAGFKYKIVLSEKPSRPLTAADFTLDGKALPAGSVVTQVSDTEYTVIPTLSAGTTGTQQLAWSAQGKKLTDLAGNPFADDSSDDSLSTAYDLRVPGLVVRNTTAPKNYLVTESGALNVEFEKSGGELNGLSKMSLLGRNFGNLDGNSTSANVPVTSMNNLTDGFYSLVFNLEDLVGNKSTVYQVLEVDANKRIDDAWIPGQSNQSGTPGADYFVDRAGSQTLSSQGTQEKDAFFWLKANAGTNGASNTDRVINFNVGTTSSTKSVIDIKDLLSRTTDTDLAKYLQVKQVPKVSTDINSVDETRLYINHLGNLSPTTNASLTELTSTSTQIIILDGVNKTLEQLVTNVNLIWQAPVI